VGRHNEEKKKKGGKKREGEERERFIKTKFLRIPFGWPRTCGGRGKKRGRHKRSKSSRRCDEWYFCRPRPKQKEQGGNKKKDEKGGGKRGFSEEKKGRRKKGR